MAPRAVTFHATAVKRAGLTAFAVLLSVGVPVLHAQERAQEVDLVRLQCMAAIPLASQAILHGQVTEGHSGVPLPSTIHLAWGLPPGLHPSEARPGMFTNNLLAPSGDGRYIFCDVPVDNPLFIWAYALDRDTGVHQVRLADSETLRHDMGVRVLTSLGDVVGTVVDHDTGEPIPNVVVTVSERETALTDTRGHFRIANLVAGAHMARFERIGYGEPEIRFVVESDVTSVLDIRLPVEAIAMEPLVAVVDRRAQWLERSGFCQRLQLGLGSFVLPSEMDQVRHRTLAEVLNTVPGVRVTPECGHLSCRSNIRMQGNAVPGCIPTIYVDGRETRQIVPGGSIDFGLISPTGDVAAIETYRGLADTPAEFLGSRCGAIVIWTRRGSGTD